MSKRKNLLVAILSILFISACTPQSAPVPTPDKSTMLTMIAGTAAAKAAQTAEALTALPLETPTSKSFRPTVGSTLTTMPNGTTFFSDATTGIEMLIPENWMALRIGETEYYNALTDKTVENLGLSNYLTTFRGQDPNIVRLLAFDIQEGHQQNLFPTIVIVQTGYPLTLEEVKSTAIQADRSNFLNVVVLSQGTRELIAGTTVYTQELTYTAGTISTGDLVDLYVYRIFFETNGNVTTIQLQTLNQQRPMAAAQFEVILASLAFFTP